MVERRSAILEYGKIYKEFMTSKIDQEKESIMMGLRTQLINDNQQALLTVIEKCIEYDTYGGSNELVQFIQLTKKLVVSVNNKPKGVYKLTKQWEELNPMDKNRVDPSKCADNLTAAMLTKYTYDYLVSVI